MSALSPRRRRHALRAAVASAALASAVLAPAAAAFAAEPAAPAPAAPAAKAAEQATGTTTPAAPAGGAQKSGEAKTETSGAGKKTEAGTETGTGKKTDAATRTEPEKKDAATRTDAGKGDGKAGAGSDKDTYPTTFTLVDGHRIAVGKDRPNAFRAELAINGRVVLILSSENKADVGYYGSMRVVLNPNGTVESSWSDKGDKADKAQYIGMETLPQGGVVRVYKVGPNHYQGKILRGGAAGATLNTIEADGKDGYGEYKGQRIRLSSADGSVTVQVMAGPSGTTECTATVEAHIGAGTIAVLTNGPKGPQVRYKDGSGDISGVIMDREHPSDGRTGKIVDPYGANPQLVTKMQGGGYPSVVSNFPVGSKDCGTTGAKGTGSTGGGAKATNASTQLVSAGAAQTKAVPQGGVAAGAEGVRGDNETALLAAGGALASVSAAGIAFAVFRRRAVGVGA